MARKRANGEGSIYQRKDGRWGYSFTYEGKQINRIARTQAEAARRLREEIAKTEAGTYSDPTKITVEGWLHRWLKEYAATAVRPSTLSTYQATTKNHLVPSLGKIRIQQLRQDQIQAFVNAQNRAGLSPSTTRRHLVVLKTALEQARSCRIINHNPAEGVKLPKSKQKEIEALSLEETEKLLAVLPNTTNGRAIRFILGTGLRVSELCGLRWCDLEKDGFNVNQTTYTINGQVLSEDEKKMVRICAEPKTEKGKRYIPFNQRTFALTEEQRFVQISEKLRAGEAWEGGEPGRGKQHVFATATGKPADRHNIGRAIRQAMKKAELKERGPHALRHTFATLWVQRGQDIKTLSEILGHSKVSFTMQTYVHSSNEAKKKGMAGMEDII